MLPPLSPADDEDAGASSSSTSFVVSYLVIKCLSVLGLFLAYDLLKTVHLGVGLFCVQFICTAFLVYRQRPLSARPRLTGTQWLSVCKFALLDLCQNLAWFYGLTLCGPLRTVLVTLHPASALVVGFAALFCGSKAKATTQARTRGAVFFLLGTLALLLIDHDDNSPHHQAYHAGHASQHAEVYTFFTHMFSWTDISDHKGGVLLLFCLLLLQSAVTWYGRLVAVGVAAGGGGAKRLNALSSLVQLGMLSPWALYHRHNVSVALSSWQSVLVLVFVAFAVKLASFYAEATARQRSDRDRLSRLGSLSSFLTALVLGSMWTQSASFGLASTSTSTSLLNAEAVNATIEDHQMSPGVVLAAVLFTLASLNLTSLVRSGTRGFFVGYSAAGLPLYNLTSDSIHETGQSMLRTARQGFKQIVEDANSRRIFYFLLLNLFFTFVELAYGVWTNSLGLISDGFHMLFDCSALVMGLYAAVMARWSPTKAFSFGYDRLEILSGFVNGLFLAVIALNVFHEGLKRLFHPPNVGTERLFAVSLAGLIVNLVGILAFSGSHGHSHGGGGGGGGGGHGHSHNVNMQGVFLHILADTLGSVGVIVSSLLIEHYGLFVADPVCSIFIAVLIFLSVLPLLRKSAEILLLFTPPDVTQRVTDALYLLTQNDADVRSVTRACIWCHTAEQVHANVTVLAEEGADQQRITDLVTRELRDAGVHASSVQVEKEEFNRHLKEMGSKLDRVGVAGNLLGM